MAGVRIWRVWPITPPVRRVTVWRLHVASGVLGMRRGCIKVTYGAQAADNGQTCGADATGRSIGRRHFPSAARP
jgi:hypothetical protein